VVSPLSRNVLAGESRVALSRNVLAVTASRQARFISTSSKKNNRSNRSRSNKNTFGMMAAVGLGLVGVGTVLAADKVDYNAVRKDIADVMDSEHYDDGSYGPVLVRLAWHAAGTYCKNAKNGGSFGGTMRFEPESKDGANAGLQHARERLEKIKKKYPGISYGDLWTLAGVVAIEEMGGPKVPWRPGRVDAPDGKSCPPVGRLPDASKKEEHVRQIFYRMGFDDREIVALVGGGHSIGRCHRDRSGFDGPWTRSPTTFSNEYFRLLLEEKWTTRKWNGPIQLENSKSGSDLMMLPADLALIEDKEFRKYVELYSKDKNIFFSDFAKSFSKLLELGCKFPEVSAPAPAPVAAATGSSSGGKSWWQKLFG